MGNSEVGHLNLGAGQVVRQDLTRIDDAVEDGSFFENEVLRAACAAGREAGRLHLLGLVSAGGVHASMDHLRACIELARRERVPDIVLHAFTDGRDTLPDSGAGYLAEAEEWLREAGGRVASVSGRYYAMDRDSRWERTQLAVRRDRARRGRWPPRRERGGGRARRLRARGDRRVRAAHAGGGGGRGSATATRSCSSTSGPIAPAS